VKRSYIQDPVTLELVPKEEYRPRSAPRVHEIMPDIKGYRSMIDGSWISSRSKHRAHLREHNCIEIGNEKQERRTPKLDSPKPEIIEAAKMHGLLPR
jgi:hypothetical protein